MSLTEAERNSKHTDIKRERERFTCKNVLQTRINICILKLFEIYLKQKSGVF